jgi:predicted nicotinamide N-methyase
MLLLILSLLSIILIGISFFAFIQILILFFDFYARTKGAYYAPSQDRKITTMLELAQPVKGKRVVDLGSGDGKLVLAFARAGAQVIGYEINPFLVWQSRLKLRLFGASQQAQIINQNYWDVSLKGADFVVFYGIDWMMARLEKKLRSELRPGAKVISNTFVFPNWKPNCQVNGVIVYCR